MYTKKIDEIKLNLQHDIKKEMGKISSGQILEILGTDPGSRNDLPGWCEKSGHEFLGEREGDGFIHFFIKKG